MSVGTCTFLCIHKLHCGTRKWMIELIGNQPRKFISFLGCSFGDRNYRNEKNK